MKTANLPDVICLLGPTASGKTSICIELARHFPIEVVSIDSALVYRGMDIGTAKPVREELLHCPHHLINILDPNEHYSAAKFKVDAERLVHEIVMRDRIPVLSGGTMMYYKALKDGLNKLPERDDQIREGIDTDAEQHGWPYVHEQLRKIDPETAQRLSPNDSQRIQRAMEVFQITGQPMSKILNESVANKNTFKTLGIALMPESRATLHKHIETRFKQMIAQGLIDEVIELKKNWNLASDMPSMRCVGYRQVWEFLDGNYNKEVLIDKGSAATRQLAKRQLTWLRSFSIEHTVDPYTTNASSYTQKILRTLQR
jgi:tRNA dimethylallyltransferase